MPTKMSLISTLVCSLAVVACSKESPAPAADASTTSAAVPKQTAAPANPAAAAPAKSAAKGTSDAPKKLPADKKKRAVPADWVRLADAKTGFAFALPSGAELHSETHDGVTVHVAELDKPHHIKAMVTVYKDASRTQGALEGDVKSVLEALGNKDVSIKSKEDITDDYRLVDVEATGHKNEKWRLKALLATDITDNYLFIVGSPASEFKADEETIDEVWGSFEMWSGGASGESH